MRSLAWRRTMPVLVLLVLLVTGAAGGAEQEQSSTPAAVAARAADTDSCQALAAALEEHNRQLTKELRQIKRELAALNQNLERPGAREIIAGVGAILGLFGAAALVAARRQAPGKRGI